MPSPKKRLRSGFTTGACAAAAAKAAGLLLAVQPRSYAADSTKKSKVIIPFPDGQDREFAIKSSKLLSTDDHKSATASIIKDAGDDPDVTNGAEIIATISVANTAEPPQITHNNLGITFLAGEGIGRVTKPGLALAVGEPAINPVPRQMITAALTEINWPTEFLLPKSKIMVEIAIPKGQELAEKTLNYRLGIVGGLSILGTTGIVKPISAEAWTATIQASMAVARAADCEEIVLSTGRTSEKAAQTIIDLPVEAFAMMGDYLSFSLQAARKNGFQKIHLAGMWAKIVKAALEIPQTHVRNGALDVQRAADLIGRLAHDPKMAKSLKDANTAREIYERLKDDNHHDLIRQVCLAARNFAQEVSNLPVTVYLIDTSGKMVEHV